MRRFRSVVFGLLTFTVACGGEDTAGGTFTTGTGAATTTPATGGPAGGDDTGDASASTSSTGTPGTTSAGGATTATGTTATGTTGATTATTAAAPNADAGLDAGEDASATGGAVVPTRDYFPTDDWMEQSPEQQGMDAVMLASAADYAAGLPTQALLVVRGGYLVMEEYFRGFTATQRHQSFSMAKSFTSALLGIAIGEGLVSGVGARVCESYEEWNCDDDSDPRSRITLEHLLTLSSGLDWNEDWSSSSSLLNNDAVSMSNSPRPIDYVLAKEAAVEPGERFQYSTGDPALLSGVIEKATGKNAYDYGQEKLFGPLGISGVQWATDADGHTTTFANLQATAREFAKFGFLFLNRGSWDGQQLVPADWVHTSTTTGRSLEPWYGYLWHVNAPNRWEDPELPEDGYAAIGVQGQHIIVLPTQDLVIVRLAEDPFGDASFDAGELIRRVLAAIQ